jgi:hypothetical protein
VQRTIRNCIFCNAAKTEAGIALSEFGQDGGWAAQIVEGSGKNTRARQVKKIAAFVGGFESREETPTKDADGAMWCSGGTVTSQCLYGTVRP